MKLNITPAGTAKIFTRHRFTFTEQAKILNLEVRADKTITGRVTYMHKGNYL